MIVKYFLDKNNVVKMILMINSQLLFYIILLGVIDVCFFIEFFFKDVEKFMGEFDNVDGLFKEEKEQFILF